MESCGLEYLRLHVALPRTGHDKCRTAQRRDVVWGRLLKGARVPDGRVPGVTALLLKIYGRLHAQVVALGRAFAEEKQRRRAALVVVRLYQSLQRLMLVNMVDKTLFPRVTHRGSDPAQYKCGAAVMPRRLQLREGLEILVRNFIPEDRSAGWLLADVQLIGLFLAVGYQLVAIASDEPHAAQRCKDTGAEHDAKADVDVGKVIIDNTTALVVGRALI